MVRVRTVWVGGAPTPAAGGWIMGVRRHEYWLGREPSKDQPETGSVHTLLPTLTSFLLLLRGEARDSLWLSPDHVDGKQVLDL